MNAHVEEDEKSRSDVAFSVGSCIKVCTSVKTLQSWIRRDEGTRELFSRRYPQITELISLMLFLFLLHTSITTVMVATIDMTAVMKFHLR